MTEHRFTYVVAEDEHRMREYIRLKVAELEPLFSCVGTAADGEEALELVERFLPSFLITDIKMPVLTGLELVQKIRIANADMRIVIISGFSEFNYARKAIELGVDDYLLKPIDLDALQETLRKTRIRLEASATKVDLEYGLDRIDASKEALAKEIKVYLHENYRYSYSLEKLASTFGYKGAYLLRLYNRINGSTPTQDLIKIRIEKAKRLLLAHPLLEIKQVASAVGYEDPLYFSRLFKRETGQNPTGFRDSRNPE